MSTAVLFLLFVSATILQSSKRTSDRDLSYRTQTRNEAIITYSTVMHINIPTNITHTLQSFEADDIIPDRLTRRGVRKLREKNKSPIYYSFVWETRRRRLLLSPTPTPSPSPSLSPEPRHRPGFTPMITPERNFYSHYVYHNYGDGYSQAECGLFVEEDDIPDFSLGDPYEPLDRAMAESLMTHFTEESWGLTTFHARELEEERKMEREREEEEKKEKRKAERARLLKARRNRGIVGLRRRRQEFASRYTRRGPRGRFISRVQLAEAEDRVLAEAAAAGVEPRYRF